MEIGVQCSNHGMTLPSRIKYGIISGLRHSQVADVFSDNAVRGQVRDRRPRQTLVQQ
jgi:hypothetical protein